jgi:hypothetical protein
MKKTVCVLPTGPIRMRSHRRRNLLRWRYGTDHPRKKTLRPGFFSATIRRLSEESPCRRIGCTDASGDAVASEEENQNTVLAAAHTRAGAYVLCA